MVKTARKTRRIRDRSWKKRMTRTRRMTRKQRGGDLNEMVLSKLIRVIKFKTHPSQCSKDSTATLTLSEVMEGVPQGNAREALYIMRDDFQERQAREGTVIWSGFAKRTGLQKMASKQETIQFLQELLSGSVTRNTCELKLYAKRFEDELLLSGNAARHTIGPGAMGKQGW